MKNCIKNLNNSKTDFELIEENMTDSIINNINIDYPDEDTLQCNKLQNKLIRIELKKKLNTDKRV